MGGRLRPARRDWGTAGRDRPRDEEAATVKPHKFGARATWVTADLRVMPAQPGITKRRLPPGVIRFASDREARRFVTLAIAHRAGVIDALRIQPAFACAVVAPSGATVVVGRYIADFEYRQDGRRVVEDAKGFRTRMYQWKKRHVEAQYGITIQEV